MEERVKVRMQVEIRPNKAKHWTCYHHHDTQTLSAISLSLVVSEWVWQILSGQLLITHTVFTLQMQKCLKELRFEHKDQLILAENLLVHPLCTYIHMCKYIIF